MLIQEEHGERGKYFMPWIEMVSLLVVIMYIIIKGKRSKYYYSKPERIENVYLWSIKK